jgi:ankyrin repeat protein
VELLVSHLKLDINAQVNEQNQTLLTIATVHNQTSMVTYLLQIKVRTDVFDAQGKKAQDYASTKEMKKVYKDAGF